MRLEYLSNPPLAHRPWDFWLVGVLLLAVGLRLGWVIHLPSDAASIDRLPDQREYLELGRNLLEGKGLRFVDPRFASYVYAYRMPGYPIFVAICRGNVQAVRVVQALIDASVVLAVYSMARRWVRRPAALVAGGIVALNPFLIYFSGLLLTETLFTAMLVWGMAMIVRSRRALGWWGGILLLVASIHVRPSAIALPVAVAVVAAVVNRDRRQPYDWRWSPPVGTLVLILTVLALLPWAWRNKHAVDSWVWTTTNGGITLYDGFNPDATGASDQRFVAAMPQLRGMSETGRSDYLKELAWDFIRSEPGRVLILTVRKIGRTWSPIPLSEQYGVDLKLVLVSAAFMGPFFVLVLAGLRFGRAPRAAKILLLTPAIYFTLVHAASVGSLRYRIPADVPMAVIASLAAERLFELRRRMPQPLPEATVS